jgi:YggT family protein
LEIKGKGEMAVILAYAVSMFANILLTALLVRALMSWFVRDMYSPVGKIYGALINFTEPIVEPFRRLLSRFNTGMIDFSVLLAMVAIEFASNLIIRLIIMFL